MIMGVAITARSMPAAVTRQVTLSVPFRRASTA
jgi:hypothetical protein